MVQEAYLTNFLSGKRHAMANLHLLLTDERPGW